MEPVVDVPTVYIVALLDAGKTRPILAVCRHLLYMYPTYYH